MDLKQFPVYANVAVSDLDRSRTWYEEKLGLVPDEKTPGGFWYQLADDTWLHVYKTGTAGTAENTVAGFTVENIEKVMEDLRGRGLEFEDYDEPKTENGLATFESSKSAWFTDPDGNIYELSETL